MIPPEMTQKPYFKDWSLNGGWDELVLLELHIFTLIMVSKGSNDSLIGRFNA